jgi:adenylate cyclase
LGNTGDAKALLQLLGRELHALLKPQSTVIYGRDGDRYAALFVAGRAVAADLPADGPVVATLRRKPAVCAAGELAGPGNRSSDPFARAALEVVNAAVIFPIAGANEPLSTFLSLGPKRSGDLYTSSEVHLLRALADRAAIELQRFGEQQLLEQSRVMQEAMRRYVPGAVADQIARGDELEVGERDVTVLFVDLRGYTSMTENSRPEAIFSTVNRYTRAVSERVCDAGGTVVEFNGDGMMAVFGAPEALPDKERAALRAARRIAAEVEGLEHESRPLAVGIGIATGRGYVGNIQAADRLIWSAIGVTTNLAARLQLLTRELGVTVLIDAATHAALGAEGERFRPFEGIAVRGRSERIDVFGIR